MTPNHKPRDRVWGSNQVPYLRPKNKRIPPKMASEGGPFFCPVCPTVSLISLEVCQSSNRRANLTAILAIAS